jgi:hypothetical protein
MFPPIRPGGKPLGLVVTEGTVAISGALERECGRLARDPEGFVMAYIVQPKGSMIIRQPPWSLTIVRRRSLPLSNGQAKAIRSGSSVTAGSTARRIWRRRSSTTNDFWQPPVVGPFDNSSRASLALQNQIPGEALNMPGEGDPIYLRSVRACHYELRIKTESI